MDCFSLRRFSQRYYKEIELIHSRLNSVSKLGLPRFGGHLRKLCLRQNYITSLDPEVMHPLEKLVELDIYDNRLKNVDDALTTLRNLAYAHRVPYCPFSSSIV